MFNLCCQYVGMVLLCSWIFLEILLVVMGYLIDIDIEQQSCPVEEYYQYSFWAGEFDDILKTMQLEDPRLAMKLFAKSCLLALSALDKAK